MKGTRRSKVWLALGLVAAAALVLAGCPHNNRLEGGGGAGNGGGSRGGSDGVQLVITNFVSEEGAANRSASWLGGPQRTIAPEHVDLKGNTDDYVFIASGTGNGTYGPEFINVVETTGVAALNISGSGVWEVTVDAYAVAKLNGQGGVTGTDKTNIMADATNVAKIVALKDTARVLTGRATVDLGSGSQVTLTLSNDGVGTQGDVNVSIDLKTPADVTKITDNNYKVKVALYSYATGDMVATSDDEVHDGVGAIAPPVVYSVSNIPKGHYQIRLTVTDNGGTKDLAYAVEEIHVEGNRTTDESWLIYNLFNEPTKPTDLKVYYSAPRSTDLKDGYLAYFSWAGVSYNAAGVVLEIADITKYYSYTVGQHKAAFDAFGGTADLTIGDVNALWNEIDQQQTVKEAVVTTLSWKDNPQEATMYPAIWMDGSMMNGSNTVTFLMQTGSVYSARIKAAGAQSDSDWHTLGTGAGATAVGTAPNVLVGVPGGVTATEFNALTAASGLFGLYEVVYEVGNNYILNKAGAGGTWNGVGTATSTDLVSYHQYNPGAGYTVTMKYAVMNAPAENDWFLYNRVAADGAAPDNIDDRIQTWIGWKNKNSPAEKYSITNAWATQYTGHKNLYLIPEGAGGTVIVQAETSGTFDVLQADSNIWIAIEADDTKTAANAGWVELATGDTNPTGGGTNVKNTELGLQPDTTRYILNLNRGGGNPTVLYFAVGDDSTANIGTLTDKNGNQFAAQAIQVALMKGLTEYTTFNVKPTEPVAYYQMDGVASGDYTLRVKILSSSGYWQTYQVPFVVKYDDQVIP